MRPPSDAMPAMLPCSAESSDRDPKGLPKPGLVRKPFRLTLVDSLSAGRAFRGAGYTPPTWYSAVLKGTAGYRFSWKHTDHGYRSR